MKKRRYIEPTKIFAAFTFVFIAVGAVVFRQNPIQVMPLFVSIIVMYLQSRVSRYAFLLGAFNSLFYSIPYIYMTMYSMAVYSVVVGCPLQIISFINWQKNTKDKITSTKKFTARGRVFLLLGMAVAWVIFYVIFSVFGSEYLLFDNTLTVINTVTILLSISRHAEYSITQMISGSISIALYSYMTFRNPEKIVWLAYTIYCVTCSSIAFYRMNKMSKVSHGRDKKEA